MPMPWLPVSHHALVVVRPLTVTDLPAWFRYLSLPQVHEHTSWDVRLPDELLGHVRSVDVEHGLAEPVRFALALRTNDQLVGTAGFHSVSAEHHRAELAYDLDPRFWGQGIATHVGEQLTQWAHQHGDVLRVQATVLGTNTRSLRVLARCGFEREGLLRGYRLVRGVPGDFWMWSHLQPATTRTAARCSAGSESNRSNPV